LQHEHPTRAKRRPPFEGGERSRVFKNGTENSPPVLGGDPEHEVSGEGVKYTLTELKPDKMPVAIYVKMEKFTNHELQLNKGDRLYLFTDGYPDQFGGPDGKKFKYSQFKNLLLSFADSPMEKQQNTLSETFDDWKGELDQVDDVCVMGLKI